MMTALTAGQVWGRDKPRLSVIGLGKLGSPMAAVFATKGFEVVGVDLNRHFVDALNEGRAPVDEPQLQQYIDSGRARLRATVDMADAILATDITFIIVPTPSNSLGLFSNRFVINAVRAIGEALRKKNGYHIVVVTSTVMPGSTGGEIRAALEAASGREVGPELGLCYNPEFIALGTVVRDMLHPDFLLIGESDEKAGTLLCDVYRDSINVTPVYRRMNFVNAELSKISVNTFVTTKISYANMLGELCDRLPGADANVVTEAIGSDSRIGMKYIRPAIGYGGPCFPRDNKAFAALGRKLGVVCDLAEATDKVNHRQVQRVLDVIGLFHDSTADVAVLGLSYKPATPVVEESQGVAVSLGLADAGYSVTVFDPQALAAGLAVLGDKVIPAESLAAAVATVDVVVVMTPWPDFAALDAAMLGHRPVLVVDPWRIIDPARIGPQATLINPGVAPRSGRRTPAMPQMAQ